MLSACLLGHNNKAKKQRDVAGFCYMLLSVRSSSHPEKKSLPYSMSQYWSSAGLCIQMQMFDLESVCSPIEPFTVTPLHSMQSPSDLEIQFAMSTSAPPTHLWTFYMMAWSYNCWLLVITPLLSYLGSTAPHFTVNELGVSPFASSELQTPSACPDYTFLQNYASTWKAKREWKESCFASEWTQCWILQWY